MEIRESVKDLGKMDKQLTVKSLSAYVSSV